MVRGCNWGENRRGSHPEEQCGDGEWLVLSACGCGECASHEQLVCEPHFRMFSKDAHTFKCGGALACGCYGVVFAAWNIDSDAIEKGGRWSKIRVGK